MSQPAVADLAPVTLTQADGIARLTLSRPRKLNALSEATLEALQTSLDQIAADRTVQVVILGTEGPNFCAGHDLKEMTARRQDADGGLAYYQALFAQCARMMTSIVRLPQPVIAEVRGIATAAGCQLVASCDLAVAAEDARFATSGINIGLFCSTPMVALSRAVPRKAAMEMLLLGDFVPADKALALGLVNRVVPGDALSQATESMAKIIAGKAPVALKVGKEAFYRQAEMDLDAAYAYTGEVMAQNMMARDTEAGIAAFVSKQPMPPWTGQ